MKKGKTLHTIIILFIGFVVGVAVPILIGAIGSYVHPVTSLTWPKKFGDITIWVDKLTDSEDTSELDVSKMMYMAKGGILFLSVRMDKSGKVFPFFIVFPPLNKLLSFHWNCYIERKILFPLILPASSPRLVWINWISIQ